MTTRREFLAASAVGTATMAGLAGCLGLFDDDGNGGDSVTPGEVPETDDVFLNSLADPSEHFPIQYFAGYQYKIDELLGYVEPAEAIPSLGGSFAEIIDSDLDNVEFEDLDMMIGSTYRSAGLGGGGIALPVPSGNTLHVTGDFETESFVGWLEDERDDLDSLGEKDGYERYLTEREESDLTEVYAVTDGRFIVKSWSDTDIDPEDAFDLEFGQLESDEAPIAQGSRPFHEVIGTLDEGSMRAGAGYALVPLGSDTGTEEIDNAVSGVIASGISATFGDQTDLQRSITYLDEGMASESTVRDAFEVAEDEEIAVDDWSFSTTEKTVTARATLDETPSTAMLQTALPVPGYTDLFVPIEPDNLGRESAPNVSFQPVIDDGILELEHMGHEPVEDLEVRYIHDDEEQIESWDGTVDEGDTFTSEETVDSETTCWVTWRPDTVDAAVLIWFETQ